MPSFLSLSAHRAAALTDGPRGIADANAGMSGELRPRALMEEGGATEEILSSRTRPRERERKTDHRPEGGGGFFVSSRM
jgi:hypothetical protein